MIAEKGNTMIDLSPQLRRTLLICALGLLALRLIASLPTPPPQAAPQHEQHIVSDFCIGWCPK
jgi:hypothetical protein